MDYSFLKVGDGGDAALMHVTADRAIAATTLEVDSVANVPTKFIATSGTLLATGLIDPATKRDFYGHVDGADLEIDGFLPGSADAGNTEGQIVVIKPNTHWANKIAGFVMNAKGDGTPENAEFADVTIEDLTVDTITSTGNASIGGSAEVDGNLLVNGTARVASAGTASTATITPSAQVYNVTALAVPATVAVPSFAAADGMAVIIRIKDNGTGRALTFASGYLNVSGVDTPTTTIANKLLTIGAVYSAASSKWEIQGINQQA